MIFCKKLLFSCLVATAFLYSASSSALSASEVSKIVAQAELEMPLPVNGVYDTRTLAVESVGVFKDSDGSVWFRVEGKTPTEDEEYSVLIDPSDGQVEMGLVAEQIELADLGVNIDQLREMAKAGRGKLSYKNKSFSYSAAARSEFTASAGSSPVRVGYFILQCEEDVNLSLMVLNWGNRVEVLQNERIDAAQVHLNISAK